MCCALPYHDTREFQRLLGVLQLEGTMWFWLKGVQEAGVALPRNALVTRCLKDMVSLTDTMNKMFNLLFRIYNEFLLVTQRKVM